MATATFEQSQCHCCDGTACPMCVSSGTGIAISIGLLTEGNGEKPGIRKWKVNSESQVEALDKDEDKAGGAGGREPKEPQEKASSKKNFVCKACEKTFHFYCRLKVHMKRCRVARGKQIQCKECCEVKSTKKELEKHQLEVHGVVGTAKKKKKRLPVACDICGREFAHASGRVGGSRGVCTQVWTIQRSDNLKSPCSPVSTVCEKPSSAHFSCPTEHNCFLISSSLIGFPHGSSRKSGATGKFKSLQK